MALSKGELYTIVSNKSARSKKGTIVAMIKGTKVADITRVLKKIPKKYKVEEVSADMAHNMELAIKQSFPNAKIITDRFHVVKLIIDALQTERIEHRWMVIRKENEEIDKARYYGHKYKPEILSNGDTLKQLLARSRYLLFKTPDKWTNSQRQRAMILFEKFPEIKRAYYHHNRFRSIYNIKNKKEASNKLVQWIEDTLREKHYPFYKVIITLKMHFDNILNFFDNRSTNAFAESFNSKIKLFRANLRGVRNTNFFLFRLEKLFA